MKDFSKGVTTWKYIQHLQIFMQSDTKIKVRVSQNLTFDPDYDLQLTFCPHPKKISEKFALV